MYYTCIYNLCDANLLDNIRLANFLILNLDDSNIVYVTI